MEFDKFKKTVNLVNEVDEYINKLYNLEVDISDSIIFKNILELQSIVFENEYNEAGVDYIYWYLFENVEHIIYDDNSNIIIEINSLEDLWNYVESNHKLDIKRF